jgi:hypothetical protein
LSSDVEWQLDLEDDSPFDPQSVSLSTPSMSDGERTSIQTVTNFSEDSKVGFSVKVSSQATDYLSFYIDGELLTSYEASNASDEFEAVSGSTQWSGDVDWTQIQVTVPAGEHTLRWSYEKDASGAALEDKAWLDNITIDLPEDIITIIVDSPSEPVDEGALVTLDASASLPTLTGEAEDLVFSWSPARDYGVEFNGQDTAVLTFNAPQVDLNLARSVRTQRGDDIDTNIVAQNFDFYVTVTDNSKGAPISRTQQVRLRVFSSEENGNDHLIEGSGSFGFALISGLLLLLGARRRLK